MSNLIQSNSLTNFLSKNLNQDEWFIVSANQDNKIKNRFILTLKAKTDTILFDEQTNKNINIVKNGYIRGLIEPTTCCLRVVLYIESTEDENILNSYSLKDIKLAKDMKVDIIRSYIPDKNISIKLYQIERKTKINKNLLTQLLPYDPDFGNKYKEYISSQEYKNIWL